MKLDADWVQSRPSQTLLGMLEAAGHQAFFVGGCVRNGLIGHPVNDIDISTDARPENVTKLAENAGFHVVPTGIDHGTVTVVIDHVPLEVTTFRKDVATDGRRATVAFADDIADDARRRDFTMNALYARADGTVVDPLQGLDDLKARRVRFIEDAETRVREDYLRILRFFRFHAWFGDEDEGFDAEGLAACAALADGVQSLSKERVGAEMRKLLLAPDPALSVAGMRATGVLARVLPGADDRFLAPMVHMEEGLAPSYLRRVAVLGGEDTVENLRMSKSDARTFAILREEMALASSAQELGYRHGEEIGLDVLLLRASLFEAPVSEKQKRDLVTGQKAIFPVKAADLMPDFQGPALGQKLADLEDEWIKSGFQLTKSDLLGTSR